MNGSWGISHEIALRWMPLDLTDDKSTLVQVMAWCRQAPSHYLSQCWPRSPYGVTRPQRVNTIFLYPFPDTTFCKRVTVQEFKKQKLEGTELALVELMNNILDDTNISLKEKKQRFKQFQKHHPDIYKSHFSEIQWWRRNLKVAIFYCYCFVMSNEDVLLIYIS